jgi:hypothetical protein
VFDPTDDPVERIARHLRLPVRIDPALDGRVMRAIATLPAPGRPGAAGAVWRWLTRPRHLTLTPLSGLAAAAAIAALALLYRRDTNSTATSHYQVRDFQFVLVAPRAGHVSLVGDFNDWDATRTPMSRVRAGSPWTAVIPLTPGRYRYSFLVDGADWRADPAAPAARDDEFGTPSSVVTVGGS